MEASSKKKAKVSHLSASLSRKIYKDASHDIFPTDEHSATPRKPVPSKPGRELKRRSDGYSSTECSQQITKEPCAEKEFEIKEDGAQRETQKSSGSSALGRTETAIPQSIDHGLSQALVKTAFLLKMSTGGEKNSGQTALSLSQQEMPPPPVPLAPAGSRFEHSGSSGPQPNELRAGLSLLTNAPVTLTDQANHHLGATTPSNCPSQDDDDDHHFLPPQSSQIASAIDESSNLGSDLLQPTDTTNDAQDSMYGVELFQDDIERWKVCSLEQWKQDGEELSREFADLINRMVKVIFLARDRADRSQLSMDLQRANLEKQDQKIKGTGENLRAWASDLLGGGISDM